MLKFWFQSAKVEISTALSRYNTAENHLQLRGPEHREGEDGEAGHDPQIALVHVVADAVLEQRLREVLELAAEAVPKFRDVLIADHRQHLGCVLKWMELGTRGSYSRGRRNARSSTWKGTQRICIGKVEALNR